MLRAAKLLLLIAGMAVGAYLFLQHAGTIAESLRQVGWGFLPFMGASFAIYALDTWGWRLCFVDGQPPIGFARLFGVRMGGEAVNKITPLASMGGEPLKAFLITRDGATLSEGMASVAISKNVMTLAQIAFIYLAVALGLRVIPGKDGLLWGLTIFPSLVLLGCVVAAVLDFRFRRSKSVSGERAVPADWRGSLINLWSKVADFYYTHPREFLNAFLLFLLGWGAGALELYTAGLALRFQLSWWDAVALEGLIMSVNMATFFIPANAGSQEGGFALLAPLFGIATPHGVALAVLRRCRDVIWVAYGLGYLALTEGRVLVPQSKRRSPRADVFNPRTEEEECQCQAPAGDATSGARRLTGIPSSRRPVLAGRHLSPPRAGRRARVRRRVRRAAADSQGPGSSAR